MGTLKTPWLTVLLCLLVAACAAPQPVPDADFSLQQQRLQALQSWQVDGKIGLRQGERGNSASVHWQQDRDQFSLRLSGPLGIGTVLIDGNAQGVEVRNKDGVHQAASAEQLLLELTGWHIPVSALRYWARGLADPDLPVAAQQHEQGRLSSLHQGGWQIDYREYTLVDGLWLPARMLMTRPETRLTLLYKRWQLKPPR